MKFNTIKPIITLLLLFVTLISFGQKDFQGKAYYESKTTVDMSNFGGGNLSADRKKEIASRMKSMLEKTFVLTFNQSESMYKEDRSEETANDRMGRRFGQMSSTGGDLYKNVRSLEVLQEQEFFGKDFLIKDDLAKLNWELGSESKKVGSYTCFKATAVTTTMAFDFSKLGKRPDENESKEDREARRKAEQEPREITVTAWFTPEVPVNQGPEKYWGLPGLILEINSESTTIYCSKIILNPSEKEEIVVPSEGKEVTQAKYNAIVKKKMIEMDAQRQQRGDRGPGGRGGGRR